MPTLSIISATSNGDADGSGTDSTAWTTEVETTALASGVTYLVLFDGGVNMDGTGSSGHAECQLVHGSTAYGQAGTESYAFNPPDGAVARPLSGCVRITGNGSDTLAIQCRRVGGTGGDTYSWQGGAIIAIPLTILTSGIDYWSEEGANSTTAVLTPASAAAWASIGTAVRVTPVTTGPHLVILSAEAQYQADASGDQMTFRPRQTTDPTGTPTTITLGEGDNSGFPEVRVQGPASNADDVSMHIRYVQVVTLTAGTTYDFFLEAEGVDGDTEYRRARYHALDCAAFGEVAVYTDTLGIQNEAPTTTTIGPLTLADPGAAYDYVVIGSTSFQNNSSWHRTRLDLNGTDNVSNGGRGSGGSNNGTLATSDYHWLSVAWPVAVPSTSTPDYAINLDVTFDNADCPVGGEPGSTEGDPGILSSIIAWRMQVVREVGTLTASLLLPAMAAAGTVTGSGADVTGEHASDLPVPTASASGTSAHQGTAASDLPAPTLASTGQSAHQGTHASDLPVPTAAASGTAAHQGAAASDLPLLTMDATGQAATSGQVETTLPLPTASATGTSAHQGAHASTLPVPTGSAAGTVTGAGPDVTGTAESTLPRPTAAATGTSAHQATAASEIPLPTAAATGTSAHQGAFASTLPMPTAAASGGLEHSGTFTTTLPIPESTATGLAISTLIGTVATTIPIPSMDASGAAGVPIDGTPPFAIVYAGADEGRSTSTTAETRATTVTPETHTTST